MDFQQIAKRAVDIRNKYSELEKKKYGKEWTREQIMEGFVGDVGELNEAYYGQIRNKKFDRCR